MTIGGATHSRSMLRFGLGDGTVFEYVTFYTSDRSCTTNAYAAHQEGTFAVGSATTSPTGGYNITFTLTAANILLYTKSN